MSRVTIRDVANLAKVDYSTVSRVLNRSFDNHKYAKATIKRIEEATEALGYQPSVPARSIRTGKTMLLGLVVADIGNPFFSEIASHLDSCIKKYGYRMVISNTNENPERQGKNIEDLLAHRVDGLIVAPCGDDGLKKAISAGVPVVTIDRSLPESRMPFVGLNNIAAGRLLADKLMSYGYRKIGVVTTEGTSDLTLLERLDGLNSRLNEEGYSLAWTVKIPPTASTRDEGRTAVAAKLRDVHELPDAIVGISNVCTISILEALQDFDFSLSESLGLSGIDDFTGAHIVRPTVSVVNQPLQQITSEAFTLLLNLINNPEETPQDSVIQVDPEWIERNSLPSRR